MLTISESVVYFLRTKGGSQKLCSYGKGNKNQIGISETSPDLVYIYVIYYNISTFMRGEKWQPIT